MKYQLSSLQEDKVACLCLPHTKYLFHPYHSFMKGQTKTKSSRGCTSCKGKLSENKIKDLKILIIENQNYLLTNTGAQIAIKDDFYISGREMRMSGSSETSWKYFN